MKINMKSNHLNGSVYKLFPNFFVDDNELLIYSNPFMIK